MTAPRTALFQRKGAGPSVPPPPSSSGGDTPLGQPPADDAGDGVQCGNCGCMINPMDGSVIAPAQGATDQPSMPGGGGDMPSQLAAMMGGG